MAIKTVRALDAGSNLHSESAFSLNALATDILGSGGVIGAISATSGVAPCTGAFAVNAQSTPNMSVRVTNGVLWMTGTPSGGTSQAARVDMDAFEDVSIASNSSGSTKYDWLYMVLDAAKMANPAADASDVATLVVSRSTSNTVDNGTPPTYGLVLAVITVANGAASITNANIADARVRAGVNSLGVNANVPAGMVLQVASNSTGAVATGTTVMPIDDTIPQITEGTEFLTCAITPKSATNNLVIRATFMVSPSIISQVGIALFQDAVAGAVGADMIHCPGAGAIYVITLEKTIPAGTTSPTTIRARLGLGGAGTLTVNGAGGIRYFGGVGTSSISVTEVKV